MEDAFAGLRAAFVNCTLKRSPRESHTAGLMETAAAIMEDQGVAVDRIRAVDHEIAPGVHPDMTHHGLDVDEWPAVFERITAADILVVGSPIWLGERSSVAARLMERLYAHSGQPNAAGQYRFYGKVAGVVVTGNEDGIKHVAAGILFGLQHIGYAIPPQVDAGWVGEAGPGPSYLDEGSGGPENEFTQRNTTFMAWNLMHMARLLAGGFPVGGNQMTAWDDGERFGHPGPG